MHSSRKGEQHVQRPRGHAGARTSEERLEAPCVRRPACGLGGERQEAAAGSGRPDQGGSVGHV